MPRSCSIFAIPAVPPTRSQWDGGWLIVDGTTIVPSPEPSTAVLSSFDGGDASELFDLRDSGGAADPISVGWRMADRRRYDDRSVARAINGGPVVIRRRRCLGAVRSSRFRRCRRPDLGGMADG